MYMCLASLSIMSLSGPESRCTGCKILLSFLSFYSPSSFSPFSSAFLLFLPHLLPFLSSLAPLHADSCIVHQARFSFCLLCSRSPAPPVRWPGKEMRPHSPRLDSPLTPPVLYARGTSFCIHQTHALCLGTVPDKITICRVRCSKYRNNFVSLGNNPHPHTAGFANPMHSSTRGHVGSLSR